MKFLNAVLIIILLLCTSFTKKNSGCLELDLIIVGDFSSSIGKHRTVFRNAVNDFADTLTLSESGVRLSAIIFQTEARVICQLTGDPTYFKERTSVLDSMDVSGFTNLISGLELAVNEFSTNGRTGVPKMLIIISDGDINDPGEAEEAPALTMQHVDQVKLMNIAICSVLIKNNTSFPIFMQKISTSCYAEATYMSLANELKKLDVCL